MTLGHLPADIVACWTLQVDGNTEVVLTLPQRQHYLERHPEMQEVEAYLFETLFDPGEVHRDKVDPDKVALFYRRLHHEGAPTHVCVAVIMQLTPSEMKHSVLSYRYANARELTQGQVRCVWTREKK